MKLLELRERIGLEGLDLLWQLLNINPIERTSAEKALDHPFFNSIRASKQPIYDLNIVPLK